MTRQSLFSVVGFQAVWLACAFGASRGLPWLGVAGSVLFVGGCLALAAVRPKVLRDALTSGAIGLAAESLLVAGGLVQYATPWPGGSLAPAWVVALWVAFSATLGPMRAMLGLHPSTKAALAGFCLGPLSYVAGERLGALALPRPQWLALLAVALIWAFAMPVLLALHGRK